MRRRNVGARTARLGYPLSGEWSSPAPRSGNRKQLSELKKKWVLSPAFMATWPLRLVGNADC